MVSIHLNLLSLAFSVSPLRGFISTRKSPMVPGNYGGGEVDSNQISLVPLTVRLTGCT